MVKAELRLPSHLRLLAIDLDGTLIRSDGTVAPQDRQAIALALEQGVAVTLATGRLSSSTLPVALDLGLGDPLVCADGAVLLCPRRREPIDLFTLSPVSLEGLLVCLRRLSLSPFLFSHDAVFGTSDDVTRFPWVAGWTPNLVARDESALDATARLAGSLVTAIGVGSEEVVRVAEAALCADPAFDADVMAFPLGPTEPWVVRATPRGCSKAAGLGRLATRLGIGAAEIAAVGDWYNDLPMLRWAGWSFAMGHAPEEVTRAARHRLASTATTGGGIAEALDHIRRT